MQMDRFDELALKAWQAVQDKIDELRKDGLRDIDIAKMIGVNKATMSNWKRGERKAQNASFGDMLRYLDCLGLSVADYMPIEIENCDKVRRDLFAAQERIASLEKELAGALARAAAFQEVIQMNTGFVAKEKSYELPELNTGNRDAG